MNVYTVFRIYANYTESSILQPYAKNRITPFEVNS